MQPRPLNDSHCHFFSAGFFGKLGQQMTPPLDGREVTARLSWDWPGDPEQLASRWIQEMDQNRVRRCALMASLPGDEESVEAAVELHPERVLGLFMVDPTKPETPQQVQTALGRGRVQVPCLFPAMHGYRLDGEPALRVFEAAAKGGARAVFVHCGMLTVGVRKKLGLPSRFDGRLGNPLDLHPALSGYPEMAVIIPHFGAGALRETFMLADTHENVHLDTSSSNSWIRFYPGLTLQQVFAHALQVVGASRLLFGSDSSFFPRGWQSAIFQQQLQLLKGLGLSPKEQDLIFRDNFERLFPASHYAARTTR